MKKLSQFAPDTKVIMYKNKMTKPHKSGHSHAITVPKSQFIDYNAKYIPCATLNKDYIIYKRVTPKHKKVNPMLKLLENPNVNPRNTKRFLKDCHLPLDPQGKPIGDEKDL